MLCMQGLVIALAIAVAVSVEHVNATTAALIGGGLAVACLVVAGLLRYPWAYVVGSVLQVLVFATGIWVPAMFVLGVIFGALWFGSIRMARRVERAEQR
jgi:hypothetical protein